MNVNTRVSSKVERPKTSFSFAFTSRGFWMSVDAESLARATTLPPRAARRRDTREDVAAISKALDALGLPSGGAPGFKAVVPNSQSVAASDAPAPTARCCEWPRYNELVYLVCGHEYALVSALCEVAEVSEVEPAAKSLLAICLRHGDAVRMVRTCIQAEFSSKAAHPAQIFRSQNLASRVVGAHARRVGSKFLQKTLHAVVAALVDKQPDLEVDPTRLAPDFDAATLEARIADLKLWCAQRTS